MKNSKRLFQIFIIYILFSSLFPQKAYAYLDPGTGSYILQLLAAFVIGGLFALKMFWGKVKTFFVDLFSLSKKGKKNKEAGE